MNVLYIGLGFLFLGLGVVGAFLPILPTTPFVLLAAWCFQKGHSGLHTWLLSNKILGPKIKDWEQYGVIRKRPKFIALVLIFLSFSYVIGFKPLALWLKVVLGLVGLSVSIFIYTRPSEPMEFVKELSENKS